MTEQYIRKHNWEDEHDGWHWWSAVYYRDKHWQGRWCYQREIWWGKREEKSKETILKETMRRGDSFPPSQSPSSASKLSQLIKIRCPRSASKSTRSVSHKGRRRRRDVLPGFMGGTFLGMEAHTLDITWWGWRGQSQVMLWTNWIEYRTVNTDCNNLSSNSLLLCCCHFSAVVAMRRGTDGCSLKSCSRSTSLGCVPVTPVEVIVLSITESWEKTSGVVQFWFWYLLCLFSCSTTWSESWGGQLFRMCPSEATAVPAGQVSSWFDLNQK